MTETDLAARRQRTEVPFPEEYFGPGIVIRFRSADLTSLEERHGQDYRQVLLSGLMEQRRPTILIDCLKAGLKREDGAKFPLMPKDCEDLPFAHDDVSMLLADALFVAWHGKSSAEVLAEQVLAEAARKAEEAAQQQREEEPDVL